MTRFYVRSIRDEFTAKYRKISRAAYRRITAAYSELGVPFRVGTTYVNGVPCKWFTALPEYAGGPDFSEHARRLRIPLPPRV